MTSDQPRDLEAAFGRQVRAERARRRISQKRLAELVGERGIRLDPSAITRIEKEGGRGVRLSEAAAIASVLDIDLNELISEFADPRQHVESLREAANHYMNMAKRFTQSALESLSAIRRVLTEHPELLPALTNDPTEPPPDSAASYYEWVAGRLKGWTFDGEPLYVSESPQQRRQLGAVAKLLADSVMRAPNADASRESPRPTKAQTRSDHE